MGWKFLILLGTGLMLGCQGSRPLYHWGQYEKVTYATLLGGDTISAAQQVDMLTEDLHKAASQDLPVCPGFHAQMGYQLYQLGDLEAAVAHFQAEKALYPESAVFMDRLLSKMQPKGVP